MHPTSWFRPTNSGPSVANPGCRLTRSRGDTNETVKSRVAPRDSRTNDVGCRTVEPSRPLPWQKAQPMARKNFLPLADGRWRLWQTVRTRASDTASFRPGHAPRLGRTPLRGSPGPAQRAGHSPGRAAMPRTQPVLLLAWPAAAGHPWPSFRIPLPAPPVVHSLSLLLTPTTTHKPAG